LEEHQDTEAASMSKMKIVVTAAAATEDMRAYLRQQLPVAGALRVVGKKSRLMHKSPSVGDRN